MNLKEYEEKAARTSSQLGSKQLNNFHYLMGMVTEIGELVDTYKKNLAYGKEIDIVNVKEEVGDIMWYLINFCRENEFDLNKILDTNIQKLSARYGEVFSKENAIERNLNRERQILEQQ